MIEPAPEAERLQPGVRVRVNPPHGRDPAYSWGRVQSSDVGVVQRVHLDGKVDVRLGRHGKQVAKRLFELCEVLHVRREDLERGSSRLGHGALRTRSAKGRLGGESAHDAAAQLPCVRQALPFRSLI